MREPLRLLAVFAVGLTGCGTDGLESAPELDPPAGTDAYDPSDGQGEGGGYYTTTGQVSGGNDSSEPDTTDSADGSSGGDEGSSGSAADCEEAERLCAFTFELTDAGYDSVDLMGDFAADGWENGAAMTLQDSIWSVTVDLGWADDTEYRFRVDGSMDWIPDPENDDVENDNSVIRALMCVDFSCP